MSNNVNHNPIIINTEMTSAEVTKNVAIVGFYWTGATDGHLCVVKDNAATPKVVWSAECGGTGYDVSFAPSSPILAKGIYVDDLDGGTLLIYLG